MLLPAQYAWFEPVLIASIVVFIIDLVGNSIAFGNRYHIGGLHGLGTTKLWTTERHCSTVAALMVLRVLLLRKSDFRRPRRHFCGCLK